MDDNMINADKRSNVKIYEKTKHEIKQLNKLNKLNKNKPFPIV